VSEHTNGCFYEWRSGPFPNSNLLLLVLFSCCLIEGGARPLFPQWSHHVYPQFLPGSHPDAAPAPAPNPCSVPTNGNPCHNAHHQQGYLKQAPPQRSQRNHIMPKSDNPSQQRFRRSAHSQGRPTVWPTLCPLANEFAHAPQCFFVLFLLFFSLHEYMFTSYVCFFQSTFRFCNFLFVKLCVRFVFV